MLFTLTIPKDIVGNQVETEETVFTKPTYKEQESDELLNTNAAVGDKDIMITNITDSHSITQDGDLSDWIGLPFNNYETAYWSNRNTVNISLAYDDEYVYVALQWLDASFSNESIGYYTKTGMMNGTHALWDFLDGADDVITFGFSNGSYDDSGTWTASNRTDDSHAFEFSDYDTPDEGVLPFDINSIYNYHGAYDGMPIFDNSHTPIVDYASIPVGTSYVAYYPQTPTFSQTDYELGWNWNESLENGYSLEIVRKLNTTNSDDMVLDFSLEGNVFYVGVAKEYSTRDMYCSTSGLDIGITNKPANFTFDSITSPVVEDLLLKGIVEDDYGIEEVEIKVSGWNDTHGPDYHWTTWLNPYTGIWDEVLEYNYAELPLGEQNITVKIIPKYEDPIILWQIIDVQDNLPPIIMGVIDVNSRYPNGVPASESNITIIAGIYDNYGSVNLTTTLYYSTNFGVSDEIIMEPFTEFGTTFNAVIQLPEVNITATEQIYYNYTFYIAAKDLANYTVYSENYSFTYPDILQEAPPNDWIKLAYIIPSSVIGTGLIIAIVIIILRRKG
jgi:hypothetical protein